MTTLTLTPTTIVPAGTGRSLNVLGDNQCIKLTGQDTNQQFTLIEQLNVPGTGIPRHVHALDDELFHVLAGEVEYETADIVKILKAGDVLFAPRGIAHSWRVVGTEKAHVMLSVFPAGAEHMFEELAALPAGPPDFAIVAEICGRYGITFG